MRKPQRAARMLDGLILIALLLPGVASAQRVSFPEQPAPGVFYVDEAGIIGAAEAQEIDRIAAALLEERDTPILVVTLTSLASRGAGGYTIERYATELFNHWGIGSQEHNYGMLLLVSPGDRRARIELGAHWGTGYDDQAQQVMNTLIVPEFQGERYAEGILAGVRGMDAMARGLALPSPPQPWWIFAAAFGVFALVTGMMFSFLNSGRNGWAWVALLGLGALLLVLISTLNRHAPVHGSSGGGGGGGGAFRGGSSGGGGATGKW